MMNMSSRNRAFTKSNSFRMMLTIIFIVLFSQELWCQYYNVTKYSFDLTVTYNNYGRPILGEVVLVTYIPYSCCTLYESGIGGECLNWGTCYEEHYEYLSFVYPDVDCYSDGWIAWEPKGNFDGNSIRPYCVDELIHLTAPPVYASYTWQYSTQAGVWNNISTTTSSTISVGMQDVFGVNYMDHFYEGFHFRYVVGGCASLPSQSIGPFSFNPIQAQVVNVGILSPNCENGKDSKVSIQSINRSVLNGELLTYTVYKPDNTFIAQISSSVTPSAGNPIVIDGSNASIAPFGIGPGDYKILVTSNKSLCGPVAYYTVPTIPNPTTVTFSSGSSPPSCFGGTNGSINVSASGGTGSGYQYSKDGGSSYQATSTFSALAQGNYNIRVKDGNGCLSGVTPVSITQPADISATAAVTSNFNGRDISCSGSTNGIITVNASGGTGTLQYSRDGTSYQSSNVFTSLGAGTYAITVRDANNCTRNSAAISLISPSAITVTPTPTAASCFGVADGSVTVSASGGTGALQYSINGTTFQSGTSFSGLNASTYAITVRDINLCTTTQNATVTQPLALLATGNASLVTCSGGNDGTVTITGTNGTAPYTYSFNGGAYGVSNNFTSLSANSYAISVKDSKGCIGNSNVTVTSNPVITGPIMISTPINCNGGNNGVLNLTPGGGVGPYTFNWSNGSTAEDLTNVIAGSYTVTITDSKSCSKAFSQTLTQPSPISIAYTTSDYNGFNIRCFGNTNGVINLTASGGNGGYAYNWSNGSTTEDLSSLAAGTYTVNVLDSKSCSATQSVTLSQPTQLTSNQTLQNVLCFGGATGGITFVASGGAGSYEYSINNGTNWQPAPVFSNLFAGNYQTITRDLNNCQATATRVLTSPPDIVLSLTNVQNTTCNQNNGAAQASVTGGVPNYNYGWFDGSNVSVGTTSAITNLPAGTYRIVVTDQNACIKQQTVAISSSNGPQVTSGTILPASCHNAADGSATINITGGTSPYTIVWPNGQSVPTATNLSGGIYLVEVRDNTNCLAIQTVTVPAPPELLINTLSKKDPNCTGNNDGEIAIEATGGNGNYSYSWNTGANTSVLSALVAGSYSVTVNDVKNCSRQEQIILVDPPVFTVDLGPDQRICEGMEVTLTPQEENATYEWTASNGFSSSNQSVQITQAGTYTLRVITAKGCEATDNFELIFDTNLLKADFLMTSEAYAGDTVILIDISWPLPEQTQWSYQTDPVVVEETRDYAMIRYDNPGEYTIGMQAKLAQCSNTHEQLLTILEAELREPGTRSGRNIVHASVFPNPSPEEVEVNVDLNREESIVLELYQSQSNIKLFSQKLDKGVSHVKALNLSVLPRGMYLLRIIAGKEIRVIKIVKQ